MNKNFLLLLIIHSIFFNTIVTMQLENTYIDTRIWSENSKK